MNTLRVLARAEQHAEYPSPARPAWQRWCDLDARVFRPVGAETRALLTGLGAICLVAAVLGLIVRVLPTSIPLLVAISAVAPLLLLGSLLGAGLFLAAHRRICAAVALAAVAVSIGTQLHLYIASPAPRDGRDLVVMTANLHLGGAVAADVVATARHERVDALMVQELTGYELRSLEAAGLDDLLGHRMVMPGSGADGTGLWSRYPMTGAHAVPGMVFAAVAARVAVPGLRTEPTLLALHVPAPVPTSGYWQHDMDALPPMLRQVKGNAPLIIGGDFNATGDVREFRALLVGGLRDAADQAGAGYLRTWPAGPGQLPVMGIDHVLTRGAVGTAAETVSIGGSDHRALVARVRLPVA